MSAFRLLQSRSASRHTALYPGNGRWHRAIIPERRRLGRSGDMTYIEELKDVIRRLYGVESEHVESVPVKETFQGKTIWEGIVEVFDLIGHPIANRLYAWAHD